MPVSELYKQIVLEHNRAPRNFGSLAAATHSADGNNPLCGDHLRVELQMDAARIVDLRFSGECCAIATASASLLGLRAKGATLAELQALRRRFEQRILAHGADVDDTELADLNALAELRRYPARVKCALLPWATVQAAAQGLHQASTEGDAVPHSDSTDSGPL